MNELALWLGYGVIIFALLGVAVLLILSFVGGLDAANGKFATDDRVAALEHRIRSLEYRSTPTYSVGSAYVGTPAYGYDEASVAFAAQNAKKKRKRAA